MGGLQTIKKTLQQGFTICLWKDHQQLSSLEIKMCQKGEQVYPVDAWLEILVNGHVWSYKQKNFQSY